MSKRPDPDVLLAQMISERVRGARGRLKIFFGACPGVGKTYAMLTAARHLQAQGVDVVIGIVESHGRAETEALVAGLECLPRRAYNHRNQWLEEFDLDAALARRPGVLLVDELAHSNVAQSRHVKRWQDVEELLSAGINVYTTVNVQHFDSMCEVVGGITGIRITETLPDRLFDEADEVQLVDLPPEELLQRLQDGKVYVAQQAERAIKGFFRKGNLLALRELALRRTADRVDEDVTAYRRERAVEPVWPTQDSLLVCIGGQPGSEKLVRKTARLAAQLNSRWHALYVETPALERLSDTQRHAILNVLKLAGELGAKTAVLPGADAAEVVLGYARANNLAKIIIGRTRLRRDWRRWLRAVSFAERLSALAPDLDVIITDGQDARARTLAPVEAEQSTPIPWLGYALATLAVMLVTALATPLRERIDSANIVMLFLLAVLFAAFKLGRGPAIFSSFLSLAAFDFFFVPPLFSFAISDVEYLITFAVMLTVALITANLTANLRFQARVAESRERRMRALYELAHELSSVLTIEPITAIGDRFVASLFGVRAVLLLPNDEELLQEPSLPEGVTLMPDIGIAQWVFDHDEQAGCGTDTLPSAAHLYVPLRGTTRTRGVLVLEPRGKQWMLVPEQTRLLETFAALVGIAVERVHYIAIAQEALVRMESERLRHSLLASLSHDLRTPLTALVGLADALMLVKPVLTGSHLEFASALRAQALRTNAQVNNVLEMARLQAGRVRLRQEWQPLEDVVGAALQTSSLALSQHHVEIELADNLPLLSMDAVLMERVLCNILENAAKYAPANTEIQLTAIVSGSQVVITVADQGPGLPAGMAHRIFEKFTRGDDESSVPGVGLGLAIVRAIMEAHGGQVSAENRPTGGAIFHLQLPVGEAPDIEPMV